MIHDDDPTPRERTGPIHVVDEPDLDRRVTALEQAFTRVQNRGWAALLAILAGLGGVGVYVLNGTHERGALEQKIINLEHTVDLLRDDIREIRTDLVRRSALDPIKGPSSAISTLPDVLSFLSGDGR